MLMNRHPLYCQMILNQVCFSDMYSNILNVKVELK